MALSYQPGIISVPLSVWSRLLESVPTSPLCLWWCLATSSAVCSGLTKATDPWRWCGCHRPCERPRNGGTTEESRSRWVRFCLVCSHRWRQHGKLLSFKGLGWCGFAGKIRWTQIQKKLVVILKDKSEWAVELIIGGWTRVLLAENPSCSIAIVTICVFLNEGNLNTWIWTLKPLNRGNNTHNGHIFASQQSMILKECDDQQNLKWPNLQNFTVDKS